MFLEGEFFLSLDVGDGWRGRGRGLGREMNCGVRSI